MRNKCIVTFVIIPIVLPLFGITFFLFFCTPVFLFKLFKFIIFFENVSKGALCRFDLGLVCRRSLIRRKRRKRKKGKEKRKLFKKDEKKEPMMA